MQLSGDPMMRLILLPLSDAKRSATFRALQIKSYLPPTLFSLKIKYTHVGTHEAIYIFAHIHAYTQSQRYTNTHIHILYSYIRAYLHFFKNQVWLPKCRDVTLPFLSTTAVDFRRNASKGRHATLRTGKQV